jgi:uncharacterized NAD-dependent epimerase/dehydratase family protein
MRHLDGDAIPPLSRLVSIYEEAAGWRRSAPELGIALVTHALEEGAAREALRQAEAETGGTVLAGGLALVADE